jgi:selenocysteine lyase/cysteine desulfurase
MAVIADAIKEARKQFPIATKRIYLDIANMNSPPTCVTERLRTFFAEMQDPGGDKAAWMDEIASTRQRAATLFECEPSEIAFCKNTSEGLNAAANAIDWQPGDNVVVPSNDHPNNVFAWVNLRRRGVDVRLVPEPTGVIDAATLEPFVDRRTRVISVADVSFHPGQRNDLQSIAELCRKHSSLLVVDGVQAAGILTVKLRDSGIAMWAASGHKGLLSPHGIALFYCNDAVVRTLHPTYVARAGMKAHTLQDHTVRSRDIDLHDDARRFEIGNFNYSAICAMNAALKLILDVGIANIERHVLALGSYLSDRLAERNIDLLGPKDQRFRSGICVFNLPGDGWVEYFAANGVVLSNRQGSIRISFGMYNSFEEIDHVIALIDKR